MQVFSSMIAIQLCAFTTVCSPASTLVCNPRLLPYQYEARGENYRYFATLIPLESKARQQTFFLSQSGTPLTDEEPLKGGDPAGFIVKFERTGLVTVLRRSLCQCPGLAIFMLIAVKGVVAAYKCLI
jgi:hypothetical protein